MRRTVLTLRLAAADEVDHFDLVALRDDGRGVRYLLDDQPVVLHGTRRGSISSVSRSRLTLIGSGISYGSPFK